MCGCMETEGEGRRPELYRMTWWHCIHCFCCSHTFKVIDYENTLHTFYNPTHLSIFYTAYQVQDHGELETILEVFEQKDWSPVCRKECIETDKHSLSHLHGHWLGTETTLPALKSGKYATIELHFSIQLQYVINEYWWKIFLKSDTCVCRSGVRQNKTE